MDSPKPGGESIKERIRRWEMRSNNSAEQSTQDASAMKVNRRMSIKTAPVTAVAGDAGNSAANVEDQQKIRGVEGGNGLDIAAAVEAKKPFGSTATSSATAIVEKEANSAAAAAAVPADTPEEQKAVLVAFYDATHGNDWRNNEGWGSSKPVNSWFGIKCDPSGNVTRIRLSNNNVQSKRRNTSAKYHCSIPFTCMCASIRENSRVHRRAGFAGGIRFEQQQSHGRTATEPHEPHRAQVLGPISR